MYKLYYCCYYYEIALSNHKCVNKMNLFRKDIFELYKNEIYNLYGMITFS